MRASLPMYDLPGLDAATDAWWVGLAAAFRAEGLDEVPDNLTRGGDVLELWTAPDLFFSQTCGYPLTHALAGEVALVATPVYACPGCEGGSYHSEILVRSDDAAEALADLRGRRAAMNGADSQSGCSALRHAVADLADNGRFFAEVRTSGSHLQSMRLVAEGAADVCAIDTVTYHLIIRTQPQVAEGLRVLATSATAPALPYIARRDLPDVDLTRLRSGLARACADPSLAEVRAALLLAGIEVRPLSDYDRILDMEAEAGAAGYPELT
jgi:ABC-type phosphate/phosphonate transport system substrate-binding protein